MRNRLLTECQTTCRSFDEEKSAVIRRRIYGESAACSSCDTPRIHAFPRNRVSSRDRGLVRSEHGRGDIVVMLERMHTYANVHAIARDLLLRARSDVQDVAKDRRHWWNQCNAWSTMGSNNS